MSDDRALASNDAEATRLRIGWEIVRLSDVPKNDPLYVSKVVGQVVQLLKRAEAPQPKMEGDVTVHAVSPKDATASPGGTLRLTYSFSGGPTSIPLIVFVHFYSAGGDGTPVFGDDHDPPKPTTAWSGAISYSREILVPWNVAPGIHRIGVGLYDGNLTGERLELKTAGGAVSGGGKRYEVGTLKVG